MPWMDTIIEQSDAFSGSSLSLRRYRMILSLSSESYAC